MNNQLITIDSYNNKIEEYLSGTPNKVDDDSDFGVFINDFLSYINKEIGIILELGTGGGRDADYIESLGYSILRSDGVDGFIEYNKSNGKEIIKLDLMNFELDNKFDGIFANAVLLHFEKEKFIDIVDKLRNHLKTEGIFAISLKKGFGSEISYDKLGSPRFFYYRSEDDLTDTVQNIGYEVLSLKTTNDNKWIHIILKNKQLNK